MKLYFVKNHTKQIFYPRQKIKLDRLGILTKRYVKYFKKSNFWIVSLLTVTEGKFVKSEYFIQVKTWDIGIQYMYCYIHGWIYTCIRYIHVGLHSQFNEADILLHISSHKLHAYIEYEGDDLWSQLQLQTVCVLKLHYCEEQQLMIFGFRIMSKIDHFRCITIQCT